MKVQKYTSCFIPCTSVGAGFLSEGTLPITNSSKWPFWACSVCNPKALCIILAVILLRLLLLNHSTVLCFTYSGLSLRNPGLDNSMVCGLRRILKFFCFSRSTVPVAKKHYVFLLMCAIILHHFPFRDKMSLMRMWALAKNASISENAIW